MAKRDAEYHQITKRTTDFNTVVEKLVQGLRRIHEIEDLYIPDLVNVLESWVQHDENSHNHFAFHFRCCYSYNVVLKKYTEKYGEEEPKIFRGATKYYYMNEERYFSFDLDTKKYNDVHADLTKNRDAVLQALATSLGVEYRRRCRTQIIDDIVGLYDDEY